MYGIFGIHPVPLLVHLFVRTIFTSGTMDQQQKEYANQIKEQEKLEQLEQRRLILRTILTPEASERLNRIATVKPEKANIIQNAILTNVQRGMIRGKMDDEMLKSIIQTITTPEEKSTSIKVTVFFT